MKFNPKKFDIAKFDSILARGLCSGVGTPDKQVCIEAAICQTLGLPHGDNPGCVADSVRNFTIRLNDAHWSFPKARAKGLRDLGIAQLGSKETIDDAVFTKILSEKTIRVLIPALFRNLFPGNLRCLSAADLCEKGGTPEAAAEAARVARAATRMPWSVEFYTRVAAAEVAEMAGAAGAAAVGAAIKTSWAATRAAWAAAEAATLAAEAAGTAKITRAAKPDKDKYLILSANLALETLQELKSPGVQLLKKAK